MTPGAELVDFVLTPEFFAGAMTGLALTDTMRSVYRKVLKRVFQIDEEDCEPTEESDA